MTLHCPKCLQYLNLNAIKYKEFSVWGCRFCETVFTKARIKKMYYAQNPVARAFYIVTNKGDYDCGDSNCLSCGHFPPNQLT